MRLGRHRAGNVGAERLGARLGLRSGERLERAGEDDRLAGERRGEVRRAGHRRHLAKLPSKSLRLDTSPQPSRSASGMSAAASFSFNLKMSAGVLIKPSSQKKRRFFSPSPSMSKARREQKWNRRSIAWAGQTRPPEQRHA